MKLKILPPTLRKRKRYIAFKLLAENEIALEDLKNAIIQTLLSLYGERGFAEIEFKFLEDTWDSSKNVGILRCWYRAVESVIAALGMIERIGDFRVNFKILKVSGTIKKIKAVIANNL